MHKASHCRFVDIESDVAQLPNKYALLPCKYLFIGWSKMFVLLKEITGTVRRFIVVLLFGLPHTGSEGEEIHQQLQFVERFPKFSI